MCALNLPQITPACEDVTWHAIHTAFMYEVPLNPHFGERGGWEEPTRFPQAATRAFRFHSELGASLSCSDYGKQKPFSSLTPFRPR